MTSVIGNTFKLTKSNGFHGTEPGDVIVVLGYEKNDDKDRMEAALAVFKTEEEAAAVVGGAKALALDATALVDGAKAAHEAAMGKAKRTIKGLGPGSLANIIGTGWRGVFNLAEPAATPPDAALPAAVAAERAALEALRFDAARLPFRDSSGVTKVGVVRAGMVESITWVGDSISGNEVVRFTYVDGTEPGEECCTLTDLKSGIVAGKAEVDRAKADAAKAAAAASAAMAALGGTGGAPGAGAGGGGALLTPRVDVLRSAAAPGAFASFLLDVVPWCVAPGKVAALIKHEALALAEIEGWLSRFGVAASPEAIAASVSSPASAADLLMVCGRLEAASSQGLREADKPTPPSTVAYLQLPPDLSGTEVELRERTALREDGEAISADQEVLKRLTAMATASPDDAEALFRLAKEDSSESLQRILLVATDVRKALSGRVAPLVEQQIEQVRGALDRRCERAVLTSKEQEVASPEIRRAINQIRLSRVGKARLLELIGFMDSSTDADPLGGFASCPRPDAQFRRAFARLSLTWQIAWPPHAGLVALFCDRLANHVVSAWEEGASWADLSEYYRCLMLKVDAGTRRFAMRESHSAFRTAPAIDLIDGRYEYVEALKTATAKGREAALEARLRATFTAVTSADALSSTARTEVEKAQAGLKSAKAEKQKRKREAAKVRKAAKKAGTALVAPGTQPPALAPPVVAGGGGGGGVVAGGGGAGVVAGGPAPTQAEASRARIEAEVAARVPPINGRKACPFYFGPQKSCRFSAEVCREGHHGA